MGAEMIPNGTHSEKMTLERFAPLYLKSNTFKGRAVFAGRFIPSGTIIDTCPALVLDPTENKAHIESTSLYHYTYNWPTRDASGKHVKTQAVIFGLGSMFNHSTQNQNVGWQRDVDREIVVYRALRDIAEDEELCISYGDHLTFEDADKPIVNGEEETEEEHLGKIQLD